MKNLVFLFALFIFFQSETLSQNIRLTPQPLLESFKMDERLLSARKKFLSVHDPGSFISPALPPGAVVRKQGAAAGGNIFVPGSAVMDSIRETYTLDEMRRRTGIFVQIKRNGIWEIYGRVIYTRDNNGVQTGYFSENWIDGAWVNYERATDTYTNNYMHLVSLSEVWQNGAWVPSARVSYDYDENGRELNFLCEVMRDGNWVNEFTGTSAYDVSGNLLTYLFQEWKDGAWKYNYLLSNTYNDQGRMLVRLNQYWYEGAWKNVNRTTKTYDSRGNELTWLYEYWQNGAWVNSGRISSNYDDISRKLTELYESWSGNAWVNVSKDTYKYSENGSAAFSLYQTWGNGKWFDKTRTSETFNSSGCRLTFLSEYYTASGWVGFLKEAFEYDHFGNAVYGESFIWRNGAWEPQYAGLKFCYNNGKDYTIFAGSTVKVDYSVYLDENPLTPQMLTLSQNYPNPFNSGTRITYSLRKSAPVRIAVYDVTGNRVAVLLNEFKHAGIYYLIFDGKNLPSGVYFYRIESDGYTVTKKLILMK